MVIEIKENLHHDLKEEKQKKIKLLRYVNSNAMLLEDTIFSIENYAYYKIIEKYNDYANFYNGYEKFLVMCWDKSSNLEDVSVFIAQYED